MKFYPKRLVQETWLVDIGAAAGDNQGQLATALYVWPIIVPFTPGLDTVLVTATDKGTFAGSTAKVVASGARVPVTDPLTNEVAIQLPEPAGGFSFITTSGTNLPQTVHGLAISDDSTTFDGADLLGTALLPEPVELTATAQLVTVDSVEFRFIPPVADV